MPPRLARSSVQTAAPKSARNKNKKRNLDAYAIASHAAPPGKKSQVKQHRLGEFLDDRPVPKRRRDEDDDDVAALDEEDVRGAGPKRRKATFDDGDVEEGSDSEGNEWTLGGLGEDDDDSDLDSEEAFGESDEERFEGFTFRGSSGGGQKVGRSKGKRDVNDGMDLDENDGNGEEEEDDDFGDEGVDLATMLDDADEEDEAEGGDDGDSGGEESNSASDSASEDDEDESDDEERNARMRDRLEALDGDQQAAKPKQTSQRNALSVDDLLADLDPSAKKQFAAATKTKKKSERPTTLAAPLPKRQQDKLNREVAIQKAKEQLDRWRDTVIQNRRAEFLSFPLKNSDEGEPLGKDKFLDSKPQNDLEANIQRIMEESGMDFKDGQGNADDEEDAIMKAEGMAEKKMDVEEVMRRRAELRKARELLFNEERKAKRISKIKSKSYRRVHRKEKAREAEREREERQMLGLEPEDEDEKERQDRKRAEERMSTKHRDSKWAKQLKQTNRAAWDEGARDSVNEEARRREELRRRVEGKNVDSESESDGDGEQDSDEDDEAFTLRQLNQLKADEDEGKQRKGLAGMKFMRDADARRKAQNDEDIERMRKELAIEDGDEAESGDEIDDQGLGRAIFGPQGSKGQDEASKQKAKKPEMEEGSDSEGEEQADADGEVEIVTEPKSQPGKQSQKPAPKKADAKNSGPLSRSNGRTANGSTKSSGEQDSEELTGTWFSAGRKKSKRGDAALDDPISAPETASKDGPNDHAVLKATRPDAPHFLQDLRKHADAAAAKDAGTSSHPGQMNGWTLVKYDNDDDDDNASDADENPILTKAQQNAALRQRAFAGDDVEAAFRAEKAAQEASEDEKEDDGASGNLPGWGSWTGAGLSKGIKKANARAKERHHPLFKAKKGGVTAAAATRKDAKLPGVIVSERADRKGKKYLATQLPQGFERKEEYERSLRRPMGAEWGTKESVQRDTRPRVVVRRGEVVQPMERPRV